MSDDKPALYKAWREVMGVSDQQILCTWHILRNWTKNLNKIPCNDKKHIAFNTLKTLIYETDKNYFGIELKSIR